MRYDDKRCKVACRRLLQQLETLRPDGPVVTGVAQEHAFFLRSVLSAVQQCSHRSGMNQLGDVLHDKHPMALRDEGAAIRAVDKRRELLTEALHEGAAYSLVDPRRYRH